MGFEILNKLKKEKGLTTKSLSEKSGVPKGTLDKILNGTTTNPAYETIVLLSKALECPIDIFTDEDIKSINKTKIYSKEEENHIEDLRKLNDTGKEKVITYTKDLIDNPKFNKSSNECCSTIRDIEYIDEDDGYVPRVFAAHSDGIDEETNRKNIEMIKRLEREKRRKKNTK